jgi:hypothetical protein
VTEFTAAGRWNYFGKFNIRCPNSGPAVVKILRGIMKQRFNLIDINPDCAVFACADCQSEYGFTAQDSFAVIQGELAAHECAAIDLAAPAINPIEWQNQSADYLSYLAGADLRN